MMKRSIFIAATFFCCLTPLIYGQELKGPTQVAPGDLAVFEILPTQPVSWIVTPSDSKNPAFAVDSSTSRIYFASAKKGTYVIVAAVVSDGRPRQLTATLINGDGEPEPPTPKPTPEPDGELDKWVAKEIPKLVKSQNIDAERRLVAESFKRICESIEQGAIQTANNARTQFQISLTAALAKASPTAVNDWREFLVALSKKVDENLGDKGDSLTDVKEVFLELSSAFAAPLQNNWIQETNATPSVALDKKETTRSVSTSANGQRPVPAKVYRYRSRRRP